MKTLIPIEKMTVRPLLLAIVATFAIAGCATPKPPVTMPAQSAIETPAQGVVAPASKTGVTGATGERGDSGLTSKKGSSQQ